MDRIARTVTALLAVFLVAACGEPLVVLGDAPGLMRIVLGVGDSIGTRVDSVATRTRLTQPSAAVFQAATNLLYVADRGALRQAGGITTPVARIFSVTSAGRASLLLDGGGCASGTCLLQPTAMTMAPNGSLIIADQVGNRVFRYTPAGVLAVIAGTGVAATAADGEIASAAPINRPGGVAAAEDGSIYISEAGSHRVRVIGADGVLRTVVGTGTADHSGDGGPALDAGLIEPAGLFLGNGTLYVADQIAAVVRTIDGNGVIRTVAGVPNASGFSGDGGAAAAATLNRPVSLALSPDGRQLYISDQGNDRVRFIDLASGAIQTFAGTGSRAWSGSRRVAGETSLSSPFGLDASSNGFLFIVDSGHSVVWRTSVAIN